MTRDRIVPIRSLGVVLALLYAASHAGCGGGPECSGAADTTADRSSYACRAPLPAPNTDCASVWEGERTARCEYLYQSTSSYRYTGARGDYFVVAEVTTGLHGWMCVYDPRSKGLVSEFRFTDTYEFCCGRSPAIWYGRRLSLSFPKKDECARVAVDAGG